MLGRVLGLSAALLLATPQAQGQVFPEPTGAFSGVAQDRPSQLFLRAEFESVRVSSVQVGLGRTGVAGQRSGFSHVLYGDDRSASYFYGPDGRTLLSFDDSEEGGVNNALVILLGVASLAALIALLNVEEEEPECNLELIDLQELCELQN